MKAYSEDLPQKIVEATERGGPADAQAFETYLQRVLLLPELRPGRIVVIDNLSAHKTQKVRE
jgi:hypothetical protein